MSDGTTADRPCTPGEAVEVGICPGCLGEKTTFHVWEDKEGPCSTCHGTGCFPWDRELRLSAP